MAECAPIRNGDRWECNRSQLRGGPCDVGPTPEGGCGRVLKCHPTRSLRTVRGRFVRACAIAGGRRGDHRAQCELARSRDCAGAAGPATCAIAGADGRGGELRGVSCGGGAKRGGLDGVARRRSRRSAEPVAIVHELSCENDFGGAGVGGAQCAGGVVASRSRTARVQSSVARRSLRYEWREDRLLVRLVIASIMGRRSI